MKFQHGFGGMVNNRPYIIVTSKHIITRTVYKRLDLCKYQALGTQTHRSSTCEPTSTHHRSRYPQVIWVLVTCKSGSYRYLQIT